MAENVTTASPVIAKSVGRGAFSGTVARAQVGDDLEQRVVPSPGPSIARRRVGALIKHGVQRPDYEAADAVRSKTVSRPDLPCNLRFAGRFS
jgi:hypothetical protein